MSEKLQFPCPWTPLWGAVGAGPHGMRKDTRLSAGCPTTGLYDDFDPDAARISAGITSPGVMWAAFHIFSAGSGRQSAVLGLLSPLPVTSIAAVRFGTIAEGIMPPAEDRIDWVAPASEVRNMDELIDRLQGVQHRIDDLLVRL